MWMGARNSFKEQINSRQPQPRLQLVRCAPFFGELLKAAWQQTSAMAIARGGHPGVDSACPRKAVGMAP